MTYFNIVLSGRAVRATSSAVRTSRVYEVEGDLYRRIRCRGFYLRAGKSIAHATNCTHRPSNKDRSPQTAPAHPSLSARILAALHSLHFRTAAEERRPSCCRAWPPSGPYTRRRPAGAEQAGTCALRRERASVLSL